MSVSPAQNFSKPPPVPEMPTVIFTSGFFSLEQLRRRLGERSDGARAVDLDRAGEVASALELSSPQAAMNRASPSTAITAGNSRRERTRALLFSFDAFM